MDGAARRVALLVAVAALVALAGGIVGGVVVNVASEPGVCNAVDVAERGLPSVVTISAGGGAVGRGPVRSFAPGATS